MKAAIQKTTSKQALPLNNRQVADRLDVVARLLEAQDANPFRVRAYQAAAQWLRKLERPAHEILKEQGLPGLMNFPGIGLSLARTIERLAMTGRLSLLDRLRGEDKPDRLFMTVPGIGPEMAHRIHELGIETLEDMEVAAYDGRLAHLEGMGQKRIRAIRESLAGRFRRRPQIPEHAFRIPKEQPPVGELLDVDLEYRTRAEKGKLPRIAPRRFNPTGEAWLPVLHTERGSRHYTALYSNTARAHEFGTTRDWVIIYRDDPGGDGQWTVLTARLGPLRGQRIVRGREAECAKWLEHLQEKRADQPNLF
jgi:DNA polymerase (family 10)